MSDVTRERTYRSFSEPWAETGARTIVPPRPSALALHRAHVAVREAEKALIGAETTVPSYTAQWDPIDYTGDAEEALNRAIDAFEDAVAVSISVAHNRELKKGLV